MKQSKRRIALLIALILLLTAVPVLADSSNAGGANESEIAVLTGLGFMQNDTEKDFGAERRFTRGEFAAMLCGILKLTPAEVREDSIVCDDVTGRNEYAGYVKTVLEIGYMVTDKNGKFWPGEAVTFDDACYAFVALAGGKAHLADEDAAAVAVRLELWARDRVPSGKLTKGQVAALLYDTLHAAYYDQTVYGEKHVYRQNEKYLVLEAVADIVFAQGIVSGANRSGLNKADESIGSGDILIDGIYYSDVDNGEKLLGHAVNYYYSAGEREKTRRQMVFIRQNESENKILEISADLIENVTNGEVRYYNNENDSRVRTVKVTGNMDVIYNGMAYPAWSDSDLDIDSGKLTFIDNNKDGAYDVVLAESYRFLVLGYFDNSTQTMLDQYTGDVLDLGEDGLEYKVYRENGEAVSLSRVARAGVLMAVKESKPSQGIKNVFIYIGGDPVTGQVNAFSEQKVTIGETTADFAKTVSGSVPKEKLYIGRTVTAYLWNDRVVRIEEPDVNTAYPSLVYLIHAKMKNAAFHSTLSFRWCSKTNTFIEAESAKRITVDGTVYHDMNKVLERLNMAARSSNYSEDYPYAQPAQIYTDSEGNVCKIDTVLYDPQRESEDMSLVKKQELSQATFSSYNRSFYANGELFVSYDTANTTYFMIPNDRGNDNWYMSGKGVAGMSNGSSQNVEPFFVKENRVAGAIFFYITPYIPVSTTSTPGIITDICQTLNADGDEVTQLTYFNIGGNPEKIDIPSGDVAVSNLRVGDVIRWRKDYIGEVVSLDLSFSPYAPPGPDNRFKAYSTSGTTATGTRQRGYAGVFGTLLDNTDGFVTLTTSIASDPGGVEAMSNLDNYVTGSNTVYYRLEKIKGEYKVRTVSANQMIPYHLNKSEASEVYLFISGNALRMVYEISLDN